MVFVLAVLIGFAILRGLRPSLPAALNPAAPLDVEAEPNLLTSLKLSRTAESPQQCLVALERTALVFTPLQDEVTRPGCGFSNAVRIERTSVDVSEPFSLSCRAALPLAHWERHVLQPEARRLLGSEVAKIEHFGSYACRNLYSRANARRSAHATADALDIAGFVLEDGRRLRILRDYPASTAFSGDSRSDADAVLVAEFLRRIRDGACARFDVVLSPDYNAAHRDHLHFEAGARYRICS